MNRSLTIFLACFLLSISPAFGWWETGHQVVARVAAAHLTPAARTRVARILNVTDTPDALADALAQASTWADETKTETRTGDWHYIDLALQDTRGDFGKRCPGENCAPARIRLFAAQLTAHVKDAKWSELEALRFVVHLVGDIHQPLHAISDADLGGNCEHIDPPLDSAKNLHSLWDGGIIVAMNVDDRELTKGLEKQIVAMQTGDLETLASGTQDDWSWESHELAIQDVYQKLHIPVEPQIFPKNCDDAPIAILQYRLPVDDLYVDSMKPVVREQLIKGGLRLARLLNETM